MSIKTTTTRVARVLSTEQIINGVSAAKATQHETATIVRSRTGVELHGWQDKIRSKEINATTPLDANEGVLQAYSAGSFESLENGGTKRVVQTGIPDNAWNVPLVNSGLDVSTFAGLQVKSEASALAKAYSKIQGVMNPFGASVILGELKETIGFLRNPLNQTNKLAQALSDGFLRNNKKGKAIAHSNMRVAKEYAASLLELRFGILPLVGDSIAILELAQTLALRNKVLSFRCYGKEESSKSVVTTISPRYGISAVREIVTTYTVETIIRFGIKEVIDGDGSKYAYVSENLRNLANVPGVIWELTYLSWLIDYFVNINDVIASVTTSTKGVLWQSKSVVKTKTVRTITRNLSSTDSAVKLLTYANQVTTFSNRTVKRTNDALTIPSVVLRVPGYKQIQNLAAFIVTKL